MPCLQRSQCQAGWTDAEISDLSSPLKKKKKNRMRLFYRTNVSWERLCFGFPPQKLPRGDPALFQHLKKGEKQEGGKLILNQGASGFKTVLTQTYKNCLSKNGAWIRERRLNIFMRCRFYSTCVKFCSANGDYNSKLILYTPEIKHTAGESPCCSSRASWRTKHEWLLSPLFTVIDGV